MAPSILTGPIKRKVMVLYITTLDRFHGALLAQENAEKKRIPYTS